MEGFAKLKQRGANLFGSIPQHMPAMPQMHMPSMPSMPRMGGGPGMKGTWQHISLPSLPRSSHSLDIVAGNAYIFGGEVGSDSRKPVDNDMHIVVLPWSGAPADYYAVKAKASPKSSTEEEEEKTSSASASAIPTIVTEEDETDAQLKDPLTEVPLSSSPPASTVTPSADSDSDAYSDSESESDSETSTPNKNTTTTTPTTNKGKGKAASTPDVPPPRIGHATAVIGTRIFLFGGHAPSSPQTTPLNENGRVWIFETRTHTWTYLDPHPTSPSPSPRSFHVAAATDRPRDFTLHGPRRLKRAPTWKEWAEGDSHEFGIPQRPITGSIAERSRDDEGAGFGTFIIHAGRTADGGLARDTWAFDVHARSWKELPPAPGAGRHSACLVLAKGRLYRFGGVDAEGNVVGGGGLDVLRLGLDEFDDRDSFGEVGVEARGGWESILPPGKGGVDSDVPAAETVGLNAAPVKGSEEAWPAARRGANLTLVQAGGGREYLLLSHGETSSSSSSFDSSLYAFAVPPPGYTAASVTDAFLSSVGRRSFEGRWYVVNPTAYDDEEEEGRFKGGPQPRAWAGAASLGELEENAVFVAGGVGEQGTRLGDGWIFRLG